MEALKLIKRVSGDSLYIDGLSQFNDQEVEVIILPAMITETEEQKRLRKESFLNSLRKYTNSNSLPIPEDYKFNRDEIYE